MKTINIIFGKIACLLAVLCLFYSCNIQERKDNISERQQVNVIDVELICPEETRSEVCDDNISVGYLCTSESSSLRLEVYPSENNMETYSYIVDEEGNVLQLLQVTVDYFIADGICRFTCSNELNDPIMSGIYDTINCQTEITDVYGNDVVTRSKSAAYWGCNIGLGICGGIWSVALGAVSAGAGFVVGLSWTVAIAGLCQNL